MLDSNLITQAERLASLYKKSSESAFPYQKVREVLQKAGTSSGSLVPDLDLHFSTLAGYCSWGKRLLTWDDDKVKTATGFAAQGFFERHPEYSSLLPFIDQSDLNQELEIYEEMRTALLALLVSLQQARKVGDRV
jgi:hypothetical protein